MIRIMFIIIIVCTWIIFGFQMINLLYEIPQYKDKKFNKVQKALVVVLFPLIFIWLFLYHFFDLLGMMIKDTNKDFFPKKKKALDKKESEYINKLFREQ